MKVQMQIGKHYRDIHPESVTSDKYTLIVCVIKIETNEQADPDDSYDMIKAKIVESTDKSFPVGTVHTFNCVWWKECEEKSMFESWNEIMKEQ